MTTRRDLMKLGAALGLAGATPTIADRIAAAEVLMQPIASRAMLDPGSFAVEIPRHMVSGQLSNDWYAVLAPEEEAEYRQASNRLERIAKDQGIALFEAVGDYGASATALMLAMFDAGLRQGAAYEHLRRSMFGGTTLCMNCGGSGCETCDSAGYVAMKDE